mmetsp:Transcript_40590/g.130578  ORF Transcript_40590/g.130578 Transcript_40590/m.130578 type:complete len:304 (-) Transcript_40590:804-1715(-)
MRLPGILEMAPLSAEVQHALIGAAGEGEGCGFQLCKHALRRPRGCESGLGCLHRRDGLLSLWSVCCRDLRNNRDRLGQDLRGDGHVLLPAHQLHPLLGRATGELRCRVLDQGDRAVDPGQVLGDLAAGLRVRVGLRAELPGGGGDDAEGDLRVEALLLAPRPLALAQTLRGGAHLVQEVLHLGHLAQETRRCLCVIGRGDLLVAGGGGLDGVAAENGHQLAVRGTVLLRAVHFNVVGGGRIGVPGHTAAEAVQLHEAHGSIAVVLVVAAAFRLRDRLCCLRLRLRRFGLRYGEHLQSLQHLVH